MIMSVQKGLQFEVTVLEWDRAMVLLTVACMDHFKNKFYGRPDKNLVQIHPIFDYANLIGKISPILSVSQCLKYVFSA